jgi:hypothetical protein
MPVASMAIVKATYTKSGASAKATIRYIQNRRGVVLALRRLRCQACRRRFRPAEECLKGLQGGNVTAVLCEACAEAGASWPYATAAQVRKRLMWRANQPRTPTSSDESGRQEKQALRQVEEAKALVEPTAAQIRQQREAELRDRDRKKQKRPEVLLVGLDGGWVKSREHKKGMEGKVGVLVSEIDPVGKRGRRRMTHRRYVAMFQNSSVSG